MRVARQNRWMLARMASAELVHTKGLELALTAAMQAVMAASISAVERWTPRRI